MQAGEVALLQETKSKMRGEWRVRMMRRDKSIARDRQKRRDRGTERKREERKRKG